VSSRQPDIVQELTSSADLKKLEARPVIDGTPRTYSFQHAAATIVRFLDIASVSSPTLSASYDATVDLLEFVDHLQAHNLVPWVKDHLYAVVSDEDRAADLLLLGSARNDWPMGRHAIQCLTSDDARQIQNREEGFEGFFERLRPEWRRTLIDLLFFASYREPETYNRKNLNSRMHFWDWDTVYEKFVEPEKLPEKRKAE